MSHDKGRSNLNVMVAGLSSAMLMLDSGALARLRRMETDGPGEIEFWKLAVENGMRTDEAGLRLIKILALLVPRGEPGRRGVLNDPKRGLGTVLCETGLSELRLARFLTLPRSERGPALERFARWIAAKRSPKNGLDCTQLAWMLFSDNPASLRKLAEDYYRHLDRMAVEPQMENAQ